MHFRMLGVGVRVVQRHHASQMLPFQNVKASVSRSEYSGITKVYQQFIPWISSDYTMMVGYSANFARSAQNIRAVTYAHPLRGPSEQCARAGALDASIPERKLYTGTNHPTSALSPSAQQIRTRLCRCSRRVRKEGKQRLRGEPMAMGVCTRQTAPGGSVSNGD